VRYFNQVARGAGLTCTRAGSCIATSQDNILLAPAAYPKLADFDWPRTWEANLGPGLFRGDALLHAAGSLRTGKTGMASDQYSRLTATPID